MRLPTLLQSARDCRICEASLPLGPRPLLQASPTSRILIIGQAPGKAAHQTGVPWDDRSGERLRTWLAIDATTFYDKTRIALMPMGFCYPGKGASGDLPPRRECAPEWHERFLDALKSVRLTIYVGKYAFDRYLAHEYDVLTHAVRAHEDLLPKRIALPHPSPRNNIWLKKNPWFEDATLPRLRKRVRAVLSRRSP